MAPTGMIRDMAQAPTSRDWLWHPALIVFISNCCIMVIELVAGRIVAPHIGVSLYTWTGIIGVMLAGISIGNWIGGALADRFASRRLLGGIFLLAGLGVLSVLVSVNQFGEAGLFNLALPLIAKIVVYLGAIFLIPGIMLGLVSPMVIKLTLNDLAKTGGVIGRIYAASSLGSIVGTFATGYYLISAFGTRNILLGTGAALIILGLLLGNWFKSIVPATVASVALLIAVPILPHEGPLKGSCKYESDYFCIRVREENKDGVNYKVLLLDRLVHSYTSVADPAQLRYGYELVTAEVVDYQVAQRGSVDAFFIGAGGYTLPKMIEFKYPLSSTIEVAEIDPQITEIGHSEMGVAMTSTIKSFARDARLFLKELDPQRRYSLVLGDAFNDFSVPYHLTTREFNDLVRSHLSDDGIYALNIIDGNDLPFLGAFLRTLKQTFSNIYLVPNNRSLKIIRNTYIILAGNQPIDTERLRMFDGGNNQRNIDEWLVSQDELDSVATSGTVTLSDDFVPADNLLIPMFESSDAGK